MQKEKIIEIKICKHCNLNFEITDKDLEFYDKVSPVFGGQKYNIPTPTLCPDCRQQRRLSFRNERKLYKRKCDITGNDIISIYSPDKKYKVYNTKYWWSDEWDSLNYGIDFDFNRGFFKQFNELFIKVPKLSMVNNQSENSDYCNQTTGLKNCYLCCNSIYSEDCLYSKGLSSCKNIVDCLKIYNSIDCYESIDIHNCFKCFYLMECSDCNECIFCKDCIGCRDCIGCKGLRNVQYEIFNKKYSKEEYMIKIKEFSKNINNDFIKKEFKNLLNKIPHKFATIINCENCIGDNIYESKNSKFCFDLVGGENLKYCYDLRATNINSMDTSIIGNGIENCLEVSETGIKASNCLFINNCWETVSNLYYSIFCINGTNNCFGCTGLKNKSYCILNKQYTKEQYEILVPKIIEHMKKTGEWGEFFPSSISPFGYNETVAQEYFPLTKEKAIKNGFNWSDYEVPLPKVEKIIPASKLPDNILDIPDDILNWAIECEITKKPFRIIKQELEFYRKHNLPISKRHPDQRHLDRIAQRNPRKLFDRKCDKCGIEMKTTYSPDREEIVYCEECYNKEIY